MRDLRLLVLLLCSSVLVAAGCTAEGVKEAIGGTEPAARAISLAPNVADKATDVDVSTIVEVLAEHGEVTEGVLDAETGSVPGHVTERGWIADERLEPGTTYRLTVTGTGEDGEDVTVRRTFTSQSLRLDQQTYPAVAPLDGETVGVGMPVIVTFDVPVEDHETFESHMTVKSDPEVEGSWSWFSDREVHFRPKEFWPAHTKVTVKLDLNSVPAGAGIYGQQDQDVSFTIGDEVVSTVDIAKHRLTYTVNGKSIKTIPVTTGDVRHQTRRGTKIIMEKFSSVDMDAATTGVDSEDPDYYNISDVRWAMRVTNSGEFLHAAPWSVGSQGRANVSHGCTGMSTADAKWLYDRSRRGDVVTYINSSRALEDRNGWTDWNVDWDAWTAGSALAEAADDSAA